MRTSFAIISWASLAVLFSSFIGCERPAKNEKKDTSAVGTEYALEGQVVEVADDHKSVTIDHKEIPELMKAMKMEFTVENSGVLEGIVPGDNIHGRLKVAGGEYIITSLRKK